MGVWKKSGWVKGAAHHRMVLENRHLTFDGVFGYKKNDSIKDIILIVLIVNMVY